MALAVALSEQISELIKFLTEHPSPTHDYEIAEMVHTVNNYRGEKFGFVSSNAANVFCVAGFLANQFKSNKWGILLFSWAFLVSYSQIYLGVHYPLDIIFGAVLGALTGIQIYVFKIRTTVFLERQLEIRKEKKRDK
jgi:undecaprenyl-diphosphatase